MTVDEKVVKGPCSGWATKGTAPRRFRPNSASGLIVDLRTVETLPGTRSQLLVLLLLGI